MELTPRLQRAINLASILHAGQVRKDNGNLPYNSHLWSVAIILMQHTKNEDVLVAGIMHDAVENVKGYKYEDLARDFDWGIANLVRDISEFKYQQSDKKTTWLERKNGYLKKLETARHESLLICAADKIHNLISMIDCHAILEDDLWEKFDKKKKKKLWFYEEVLKILSKKLKRKIVGELASFIDEAKQKLLPQNS